VKIKYNLEYNYFSFYNEAQGIVMNKKAILKGLKEIKSYTKIGNDYLKKLGILFLLFVFVTFLPIPSFFKTIVNLLFCLFIGVMVSYYAIFYLSYLEDRKRCHRGELQFSKTGIIDVTDDGVKIGLPWHLIEFAVMTNQLICFVTKTNVLYFIDVSKKEEIKEAIVKYQEELKIFDFAKSMPKEETPMSEEEPASLEEKETVEEEEIESLEDDGEVEQAIEELTKD